ncbi:peroxisomal membrane protein 4-like [Ruditapes philippinarum]|uniref:peroxisomal membrane protein 4-like n=1 Tax=Ruditapes philippinarum TaxID=129788 RepID=UPI00295AA630|nr:peroxisomal membrane protein 4-like [Ruditapes philippinarum]
MAARQAIDGFLSSGQYRPVLSVIKGLRNGAVYGAKIRFPHALVMTFLFKEGSLREKVRAILEATFTHSKNLASFVFLYKSLTGLMEHFQEEKSQIHSFIAAFIGGYFVFGKNNKVNEQINLYLLSRIIYGLAKLAVKRGYIPKPNGETFPWFAAIVWGIVLWEFEHEKETLQSSLQSSMTYLYHDSNKWTNLKNFLWHNK